MNFDPQLVAGRRFSMAVALALLLYNYTRQRIFVSPKIQFFGFSFEVEVFELDTVLMVLIVYAAIRYFYLAVVQAIPPWRFQFSLLWKKELPTVFFGAEGDVESTTVLHLRRQAQRYLPFQEIAIYVGGRNNPVPVHNRLRPDEKTEVGLPSLSLKRWGTWKTGFWCLYEDAHYALPLILCTLGFAWLIWNMIDNPNPGAKLIYPPL